MQNRNTRPLVLQRQIRYLTPQELTRLRQYAEARALQAREKGTVGPIRAWALLDTLLSSGLRASEVAALRVGDCLLGYGQTSLLVHHGKGDKSREVFIPDALKCHLKAFLAWKAAHGEDVSDEAPVFVGKRGALTRNWIWRAVKGLLAAVGLDPRYAVHSLRHTYASLALQRGVPLLTVSRQLGHASIAVTADVYGHLAPEATREAAAAWEAILTAPGRNPGATATHEPA